MSYRRKIARLIALMLLISGESSFLEAASPPLSWTVWRAENGPRTPQISDQGFSRPSWIVSMPEAAGGGLAIGWSSPWVYPGDTLARACENAVLDLALYHGVVVQSDTMVIASGGREHGRFKVTLYTPEWALQAAALSALVLETWLDFDSGEGWCLVSDGGAAISEVPRVPHLPEALQPKWINELPARAGYIYSVGVSQDWASTPLGFLAAKEAALAELSRVCSAALTGLLVHRSTDQGMWTQEKRALKSHASLAKAGLVAWWRDPSSNEWYVLMRASIEPLNQLLHIASYE
jgi:hypothetical protein